MTSEQIVAELEPIGLKAVLADKKVKLIARVNHRDNFALFYSRTAHDAMMAEVVKVVDSASCARRDAFIDWFNTICKATGRNVNCSGFDALAQAIAGKAWDKLYKRKRPTRKIKSNKRNRHISLKHYSRTVME